MTEIDSGHSKHLPPEELVGPNGGPALGRDPFEEAAEIDPFLERLEQLTGPPAAERGPRSVREAEPLARDAAATFESEPALVSDSEIARPLRPRARPTVPSLAEVEIPEVSGWLERLLGEDERRRISALAHLVEGESSYDRFGFSPVTTRRAFPLAYALYRLYFRVRSEGHEHLPESGAVVLAANHGGLLPFDGAMSVVDVMLHTDPPRLPRAIVDRWVGQLPWVNVMFARLGQVIGTRENFSDLLDDEQAVLVFPEGMNGIRKTVTSRYRVQTFRVGFVEQALRARAPIVPMAIVGSDDQAPILYDVKPLAKALGLPFAPITPTFPLLGPLGLLPYPVSYKIVYGEPLRFHERFGPEGADDARLVRYLANQVRRRVQLLLDRDPGMTRVLVTHADEPIGRRIIKHLVHDPQVEGIVALGDGPPPRAFDPFLAGTTPPLTYARIDLAKHRPVNDLFHSATFRQAEIDTLVHLPRHGAAASRAAPIVAGLAERTAEARLVLQHALESPSIRSLVAVGSAFVYRLPPGNANRLHEDSELDLDPDVSPEIRSWIDCDMIFHGEVHNDRLRVVLLRVPTVVAAGGYVYMNPSLSGRPGVRVRAMGYDPICALVSDKDVARAVRAALSARRSGIYNVAGGEVVPLSELARWTRRSSVPVPGPLLRWAGSARRLLGSDDGGDLGPHLCHGFTLDTTRAERELRFRPSSRIGLARAGDGSLRLETTSGSRDVG